MNEKLIFKNKIAKNQSNLWLDFNKNYILYINNKKYK